MAKVPSQLGDGWIVKDTMKGRKTIEDLSPQEIDEMKQSGFTILPDNWWEFVQIIFADGTIKNGVKQQ